MSRNIRKIFGTDGVRGIANQYPMTCETALALGRAVAYQAKSGSYRHKIVIGKDTRLSGYMIEMAFASGVCSMGVDALLLGTIPTPAVAHLTKDLRADAGIMISASHNSFEDNGIKIFGRDGFKLSDIKEFELEQFMEDERVGKIRPTKEYVGKAFKIDDAQGRYIALVKGAFPPDLTLNGLKIVIDCANGAAYNVAPKILEELGAEVETINVSPNGRNINRNCGALYTNKLSKVIISKKYDIGIALDGDADRLIIVDEKGETINGDAILAVAANEMLKTNTLNNNTLVSTIMSSSGLDNAITCAGGTILRAQVGDRYVIEQMRKGNYNLGGEQSGHIIYLDHSTTGDGMIAALKFLATMVKTGKNVSEITKIFKSVPQTLMSFNVKEKPPLEELTSVQSVIKESQEKLELRGGGRILVRYSGTENKVRVLVECSDAELNIEITADIRHEIQKAIG